FRLPFLTGLPSFHAKKATRVHLFCPRYNCRARGRKATRSWRWMAPFAFIPARTKLMQIQFLALTFVLLSPQPPMRSPSRRHMSIVAAVHRPSPSMVPISHARREAAWAVATGMVIDPRGYLLTASHIVGQARQLDVTLTDGTELLAEVFHTEPAT